MEERTGGEAEDRGNGSLLRRWFALFAVLVLVVLQVVLLGGLANAVTASGYFVGEDNKVTMLAGSPGGLGDVQVTFTAWPGPGVTSGSIDATLLRSGGSTSTVINFEIWCIGASNSTSSGNRSSISNTTGTSVSWTYTSANCANGVEYVKVWDSTFGGETIRYVFDQSSVTEETTCAYGTVTGLRASYHGGMWWATWRYFGDPYYTGGRWVPSTNGNVGGAANWMLRLGGVQQHNGGAFSDGLGWYHAKTSPTAVTGSPSGPPYTMQLSIYTGSKRTCKLEVTADTTADITPGPLDNPAEEGPEDYGAGDDGDGNSCSAFDIFCRIKGAIGWAFMPSSESFDQFTSLGGDIEGKIPFVYVSGAMGLLDVQIPECDLPCTSAGTYAELMQLPSWSVGDLTVGGQDFLPESHPIVGWLRDNRDWLSIFMWAVMLVPLGLFVWRRLMPMVGGGNQ